MIVPSKAEIIQLILFFRIEFIKTKLKIFNRDLADIFLDMQFVDGHINLYNMIKDSCDSSTVEDKETYSFIFYKPDYATFSQCMLGGDEHICPIIMRNKYVKDGIEHKPALICIDSRSVDYLEKLTADYVDVNLQFDKYSCKIDRQYSPSGCVQDAFDILVTFALNIKLLNGKFQDLSKIDDNSFAALISPFIERYNEVRELLKTIKSDKKFDVPEFQYIFRSGEIFDAQNGFKSIYKYGEACTFGDLDKLGKSFSETTQESSSIEQFIKLKGIARNNSSEEFLSPNSSEERENKYVVCDKSEDFKSIDFGARMRYYKSILTNMFLCNNSQYDITKFNDLISDDETIQKYIQILLMYLSDEDVFDIDMKFEKSEEAEEFEEFEEYEGPEETVKPKKEDNKVYSVEKLLSPSSICSNYFFENADINTLDSERDDEEKFFKCEGNGMYNKKNVHSISFGNSSHKSVYEIKNRRSLSLGNAESVLHSGGFGLSLSHLQ